MDFTIPDELQELVARIHGGMGLLTEGPVEQIYRWVRMLRIVEGTSEIKRLIIARSLGL